MSKTYRDKLKWKSHNLWRKFDDELKTEDLLRTQRDAIVDEKERLAGVMPYYRRYSYWDSTHWIRQKNHRLVRHHIKTICRTHQWKRLHDRDSRLFEWLD